MKGSTLIETLIYIALLSILMIGVFSSVYVLMRPQDTGSDTTLLLKNYNE
jgi:type II secretory pathway pseudopilin PulG